MSRTAYPRLWHLFRAFFHQDWDMEGEDWPDLVRNFSTGQPSAELQATADEIERLVADCPSDAELEHQLFRELGCAYYPRPDLGGPTVREWLGQVARSLRQRVGPT
jgi:hypothetical protein